MNEWWYSDKNKKIGPIRIENLTTIFQKGKINQKTMVWQEGMTEWMPLHDVEALKMLITALPPPLPKEAIGNIQSYALAKRWPRFFARLFDIWWENLAVGLVLGISLVWFSAGFAEWIIRPGRGLLFGLFCLPIVLIFDVLIYKIIGNTPGKAILGLKVTTIDCKSLGFVQYLIRNFELWVTGLALGIPLINLFTLVYQSKRLGKGDQASYDESVGFRVQAKPSFWLRKVVFGCAFFFLFVVQAVLNNFGGQTNGYLSDGNKIYNYNTISMKPPLDIKTRLDPRQYIILRNIGATDEQIVNFLFVANGKLKHFNIDSLLAEGLNYGQIARYFSGIDEVEWQKENGNGS